MPSSAAKSELRLLPPDRIVETARYMAERRVYGVAWLDEDLCAIEHYGALSHVIPSGLPITECVDAFVGLGDEILNLQREPDRSVVVPNVLMVGASKPEERISLAVYWMVEPRRYLLLVARAVSRADLEFRLAAEVRARTIAEAEVAAQARLVQRINQELAIANRDLHEFASVISHDLRAPLRGLRYATADARAALDVGDPAAAMAHLERTVAHATRMSTMLTGLLEYARAGRKADTVGIVDTRDLVSEIIASIGAASSQRISLEGSWPVLSTVAEPLDIVLRNLIDNAVKHHDSERGQVVVRAEDAGERLLISIVDDGPGIDPAWHEAIFLPFRQVTDPDDAEGAGIGLALVKKTVERFGGTIEVVSDPSRRRGSTFRVAWPKSLPA